MIEELIRNGVTHFFVAPGSRSSPLALAVAGNKRAKMIVHFDERGLAFAALGCARATGIPAAVITTSGTAVGNLFPAVIEASMDHVPMILLSADRPPELRDCGANQAIDQVKIFGDYVRWFFDVPCPDEKISPRFVLTTIDQTFARAATGPVHLNCQYREPLAPESLEFDRKRIADDLKKWMQSGVPFTRYASPMQMTVHCHLIEDILPRAKIRGLIVAAGLTGSHEAAAVLELANDAGWPVMADIRSSLRLGAENRVISRGDHLLLSEKFAATHAPEVVVQFGTRLVSKRIQEWINRSRPKVYAVVAPGIDRIDAGLAVTHRWSADVHWASRCLRPRLKNSSPASWLRSWQRADARVEEELSAPIERHPLSEPWIIDVVTRFLPSEHRIFLSSSMPVRDADMYASRHGVTAGVFANRGASGIDGTVASAAGVAIANSSPVTLLIGDLALLHDLNSLALIREAKQPFVIVAINNNGGGIFSFLSVAQFPKNFEKIFGTPHGLGLENAAKMFGIEYAQPKTAKDFESAYRDACRRNGATLIEVRTNREENLRIHREIQAAVKKAVDKQA